MERQGENTVKLLQKLRWFRAPGTDDQTSSAVAKDRLKLALTYDRGGLPRGAIEQLRDELIDVIAKHLSISREEIQINFERSEDYDKLIASIPLTVQRLRAPEPKATAAKTASPQKGPGRRRRR
jgi:cell division topological specificity factor